MASGNENADAVTHHPPTNTINNIPSQQPIGETSFSRETSANHVSLIREQFENRGFSTTATKILETAWRAGTRKQYEGYLGTWRQYCGQRNINPFSPTVEEGINFLAELFEKGLGYSALNTARSALSSIITLSSNISFGTHPLVCRFLKGVFESRPSLPRHNIIWDVRIVLDYLKTFQTAETLTVKMLTLKLTMILALISAQQCQTLKALSLDSMSCVDDKYVFYFNNLLKTSRPGKHLEPLIVKQYVLDAKLCLFTLLTEYIRRTRTIRGNAKQLLLSFQKPFNVVSTDTISRWLKTVLKLAGIKEFSGSSTRAASSSAASKASISVDAILEAAGWSNAKTFQKYYNKPLPSKSDFGYLLLQASTS